ncbi:hypothetical protein Tco_1521587, partial [Tanacetum coccineum]
SGPYETDPPCPDEIKNYVQEEREGFVTRIRHDKVIDVEENQIQTREIVSEQYNIAFFIAKRMEFITKQAWLILPYGMLLTRLFNHTRKDYGTRKGRSSTSSASAFSQPSSSHPNDDDNDGNDEGTSHASTPSPTCFVNLLSNEIP